MSWESAKGMGVVVMAYERAKRTHAASPQPAFSVPQLPNATFGELQEAAPTVFALSSSDSQVSGFKSHATVPAQYELDFDVLNSGASQADL